jgi:hypothetical protein
MLRLFDEKNGRLLQVRLTLRYAAFFSALVWLSRRCARWRSAGSLNSKEGRAVAENAEKNEISDRNPPERSRNLDFSLFCCSSRKDGAGTAF